MTPQQLTDKLRTTCGERLRSVILYGSAAAGDHTGKRSDYNVLVVLDRIGLDELKGLSKTTQSWVKAGNPAPLLFTEKRLAKSTDVFPIEISDIKRSHKVLFGEDLVSSLTVREENLRWQLESGLKSMIIGLRARYLLTKGKPRQVKELLIQSLTTCLVLFRATLGLYQPEVPAQKMDALRALAKHVPFDTGPFETIGQLKEGRKVSGVVPDVLFTDYLRMTEAVVDAVDDFLRTKAERGGDVS